MQIHDSKYPSWTSEEITDCYQQNLKVNLFLFEKYTWEKKNIFINRKCWLFMNYPIHLSNNFQSYTYIMDQTNIIL